jgi:ribosomal protein L22
MTPSKPQDPDKGKVDETTGKVAEDAKAAKETAAAEPKPTPKRTRAKKAEAASAGGEGRSEAGASDAEATEAKPKRSRAKKPAAADAAPAEAESAEATPKPSRKPAPKKDAPKKDAPKADAPEKDAPKKDAPKADAPVAERPARRRDRRPAVEPGVVVRAQAKYVRTSARKARLVCDHIRGKDVVEARSILAFTPRAAAKPWLKLLESAVANAEHNHELIGEELRIAAVHADEGPTLKRFRPRAMGRATKIRKRTSHLTITLTPKEHR